MQPHQTTKTNRALLGVALSILLLTTALAGPSAALAGGYDVHSCDASFAGGANHSWIGLNDPGTTAYAGCPAGTGLTARNVYDNGTSGSLQGAFLIFDAAPGTSLGSVSFEAGWQRASCSWNLDMVQSSGDLGGSYVWGLQSGQSCDSAQYPGDTAYFPNYRWSYPLNGTRLRVEARCGASSCPRNGTNAVRIKNVTVHVSDNQPPALTNGRGNLWTSTSWLAGTQGAGFDAADGSGIRETSIRIDGKEVGYRSNPCDYSQRTPCPGGGMDEQYATGGLTDGKHTVTLAAVDAGGNEGSVSRDVLIDNTAPAAPEQLAVDGGQGWRSSNSFNVHWQLPTNSGAPITAAQWDMCPRSGPCTHGSQSSDAITSLNDLHVPKAGEWTLKLWLQDAAANQDARLAAAPVSLRFDDVSPQLAFEALSASDPTLLSVQTSDEGSGVASGQIDVRKTGDTTWTPLSTSVAGTTLSARIDDEHFPQGHYELRAQATDQAGNQRSTTARADGSPAGFDLPLRLVTKLRAGIVRRHGRKARLAQAAVVHYGSLVRVSGRLATPEDNPMQDVDVQAFTQVQDGVTPQRLLATVKTTRTGHFSFLVRRGPSRTVEIRYGGTPQIRAATLLLRLSVRSGTSIRPSRRSVVNGEDVRFHGRIATGRIPAKGKLVEMQVFVRGKWRTFVTTRAGRHGTWQYNYRFDGTRGSQQYRFRAKLPPEAGYPFATGLSRVVQVAVHGT